MYLHMNEDIASQRLHELQRELDASGFLAVSGPNLVEVAARLLGRALLLTSRFARRPKDGRLQLGERDDGECAPDVA